MIRNLIEACFYFLGARRETPSFTYLDMFLACEGCLVGHPSKQSSSTMLWVMIDTGGLPCLHRHIFKEEVPWVLEDLTLIDRWLIGTFAYGDESFRRDLIGYLNSFQPQSPSRHSSGRDEELPQPFEMPAIAKQVKCCTDPLLRFLFLQILLRFDSSITLNLSISAGLEIEEPLCGLNPTGGTWLSCVAGLQKP